MDQSHHIFEPQLIGESLATDLVQGLRDLAYAIEAGEIAANFAGMTRCPLRQWHDERNKSRIVLDVACEYGYLGDRQFDDGRGGMGVNSLRLHSPRPS